MPKITGLVREVVILGNAKEILVEIDMSLEIWKMDFWKTEAD